MANLPGLQLEQFCLYTKLRLLTAILMLCTLITVSLPVAGKEGVPTVDGEAGPCSVEFMVIDANGGRVYAANIQVHIDYGLFGVRKLDLQVGTNSDGLARFTGLPDSTDGVLYFEAFTDELKGVAVADPTEDCHAQHDIYMGKR